MKRAEICFRCCWHVGRRRKKRLIYEVLSPLGHNLMVTPKEVDTFIEDMANVIASGLNAALHHQIDQDNTGAYTH